MYVSKGPLNSATGGLSHMEQKHVRADILDSFNQSIKKANFTWDFQISNQA